MQVYLCFRVFFPYRVPCQEIGWEERPVLCRVGRKTLLRILLWCDFIFYCENCCRLHGHLPVYTSVSLWFVLIRWPLQRLAMQLLVNVMWRVVTVVGVVHCTAFSLLTVYRLVLLLGCDWFIINICSLISLSTFTHAVLCPVFAFRLATSEWPPRSFTVIHGHANGQAVWRFPWVVCIVATCLSWLMSRFVSQKCRNLLTFTFTVYVAACNLEKSYIFDQQLD